ncbi:MAG: ABC transporter ATP-binding protein [Myxococcota bacterium]|nr:ABC transporter ATP-binding protein [Myxococcota bacterium]
MSETSVRSAFSGAEFQPSIVCSSASMWYGKVIALNDVSFDVGSGVVGLLGPNGAGKSTLMRLLVGLLRPTSGSVTVFGQPAFGSTAVRSCVGYCPEHDYFYEDMTGLDFVRTMTQLYGYSPSESLQRAKYALDRVGLPTAASGGRKRIREYSKGMRQKVKLAQALAHEPDLLVLDEPLTGTDPMSRHQISELCRQLGDEGRTVIVSSHVLHEVERITHEFILIDRGRLLAKGNVRDIRQLIDQHPHRIELVVTDSRALASRLISEPYVSGVTVTGSCSLLCETVSPDACYDALPRLALESGVLIRKMSSPDNNLEAVFRYLTR